jgi:hypothetical protein
LQKGFGVGATLVGIALLVTIGRVWRNRNLALGLCCLNADLRVFFGVFVTLGFAIIVACMGERMSRAQKRLQADGAGGCGRHGHTTHVSEKLATAL